MRTIAGALPHEAACQLTEDATELHGEGSMIAKIEAIRPSPERPERLIIEIGEEYARIRIPDVWQHWRNPVRYRSLAQLGISPDRLKFTPLTAALKPPPEAQPASRPIGGMTILEAKKGLAPTLGVHPDAVEITIRG